MVIEEWDFVADRTTAGPRRLPLPLRSGGVEEGATPSDETTAGRSTATATAEGAREAAARVADKANTTVLGANNCLVRVLVANINNQLRHEEVSSVLPFPFLFHTLARECFVWARGFVSSTHFSVCTRFENNAASSGKGGD